MPWKVPDQASAAAAPSAGADARGRRSARPAGHLAAARREKVISRMRRGSAPLTMRWATRWASVLVLPEPAPAMTRSGPAMRRADPVLDGAALVGIEAVEIGGGHLQANQPVARSRQRTLFTFCSQWDQQMRCGALPDVSISRTAATARSSRSRRNTAPGGPRSLPPRERTGTVKAGLDPAV